MTKASNIELGVAESVAAAGPPKKRPKATGANLNKGLGAVAQLLFVCGQNRLPTPRDRVLEKATLKQGEECAISRNTLKKYHIIHLLLKELEAAADKNDYSYFTKTHKWFIGRKPQFEGELITNWNVKHFKKKAPSQKNGCLATQKKNGKSQTVAEEPS